MAKRAQEITRPAEIEPLPDAGWGLVSTPLYTTQGAQSQLVFRGAVYRRMRRDLDGLLVWRLVDHFGEWRQEANSVGGERSAPDLPKLKNAVDGWPAVTLLDLLDPIREARWRLGVLRLALATAPTNALDAKGKPRIGVIQKDGHHFALVVKTDPNLGDAFAASWQVLTYFGQCGTAKRNFIRDQLGGNLEIFNFRTLPDPENPCDNPLWG